MGCIVSVDNEGNNEARIEDTDRLQSANLTSENASNDNQASEAETFAKIFTHQELTMATRLRKIGQGGFGNVYKSKLENGEIVAIKELRHGGAQGSPEFRTEVQTLSGINHPNLVTLIGYCTNNGEKQLVYEYMPKGCLEDHLFDLNPSKVPLDWNTRIKIAVGTARGLEYLHYTANPPIIHRDLKAGNILLDNEYNPKICDFGLAKFGPVGEDTHVSTRIMGTYGYCAPEYAASGRLTVKSDVYSFGVLLLELITGRKAIDNTRVEAERYLVRWSRNYLGDKEKYAEIADPALEGRFPTRMFNNAIGIIIRCLYPESDCRPTISHVREALEFLDSHPYNPDAASYRNRHSSNPHT